MLDEGVLFEHYERTLKPRVRALEKHREALLRAWKNAAILVGIPGFILYLTAGSQGRARYLAFAAGVALLVGIAFAVRPFLGDSTLSFAAYRERFKRDVVSQVFRLVLPQATYTANAGIARATFDESGLFTTRVDSFASDDLVRGRIGATPFEAADVQARYTTGSGKNRKTWDVLRGLYLRLDFNKHLRGRTIVEPESAPAWRMGGRAGLQKVKLEDPDFERRYAVFSSDAVEARYVLTPLLMERVLSLEAQAGHSLHLAFLGNHVHLAVHYGAALFEPSLLTSVSYEAVVEMARHFGLAEVIVSELDLNVRIWSKGAAEDPGAPAPSAAVGVRPAAATGTRSLAPLARGTTSAPRPAKAASVEQRPLGQSRQEILAQLAGLPGASLLQERPWWASSNLIGLGVGVAVYSRVYAAMKSSVNAPDAQGIVLFFVALVAAFVAGIGFSIYADTSQGRRKQVVYLIGIVVFWFGFMAPLAGERAVVSPPGPSVTQPTPTPTATPTWAEREAARRDARRTREELVTHLRATGAHGPLGVVPPMLEVQETGRGVRIKNLRDSLIWVVLARVEETDPGSGVFRACELHADPGRNRGGFNAIKRGEVVAFNWGGGCRRYAGRPIEYRVGRHVGDESWWSDSALLQPEGHRFQDQDY